MSGSHSLEIVELSLKPRSAGVHVLSTTPDCLPRVPQGLHFSWKTIFQSSKGRQLEEQFHRGERVEPQSWLLSPGVLCPLVAVLLITIAGERGHCVFLTVPTSLPNPIVSGTWTLGSVPGHPDKCSKLSPQSQHPRQRPHFPS